MTTRYTTAELMALANDKGPFALDNMRQAIRWAARTLEAADAAVKAEYQRAEALKAQPMQPTGCGWNGCGKTDANGVVHDCAYPDCVVQPVQPAALTDDRIWALWGISCGRFPSSVRYSDVIKFARDLLEVRTGGAG